MTERRSKHPLRLSAQGITGSYRGELFCSVPSVPLLRLASIGRFRNFALRMALRLEGGHFYSWTARRILQTFCEVEVGAYSYGACFRLGAFPPRVKIGRYVSIGPDVRVFLRHHPLDRVPMHPFFYNQILGYVSKDNIPEGTLEIGHEAWIGERAIITSKCKRIGIGAVIGAGAVVTKDVPNFAVVVGNPARIVKYRFDEELQNAILNSKWWERSADELAKLLPDLVVPPLRMQANHPLLRDYFREPKSVSLMTHIAFEKEDM